jgi:tetratricopeptide (TPR) repeat protein
VQLQSLGLAKHAGDCRGELPAVGNLGSSLQAAGRLEAALEQFREAFRIAAELGDRASEAMGLEAIEDVLSALGRSEDAAEIRRLRGESRLRSAVPID